MARRFSDAPFGTGNFLSPRTRRLLSFDSFVKEWTEGTTAPCIHWLSVNRQPMHRLGRVLTASCNFTNRSIFEHAANPLRNAHKVSPSNRFRYQ